jgi:serine/threonine protein kinase
MRAIMSGGSKITGEEPTIVAGAVFPTVTPSSEVLSSETPSVTGGPQVVGGRYDVLGLVGVGGMGSVYRVRDRELDEIVALKMLRKELLAAPGMLERFRQEAKLARRVTHRNVARTFDIGEHGGDKFLTMEFVDGESLAGKLAREGALSMREVAPLIAAICDGLSAAHAAGVVHRDLKPDNVLLAKDGRVVITDFGIARATVGAAETMGMPIGTPTYMAPEQVEGAQDVDARADIYALGAILYELLTGERAWKGDAVYVVAAARLMKPPPDPRAVRKEVGEAAAALVQKCMARARGDRYASAAEVASAMAEVANAALPSSTMLRAPSSVLRAARDVTRDVATESMKTIAVLPFRNTGHADDEYIADGLTDDLIDALSMTKGLKVRGRGAVMRFKGVDRDARELGRELDVQVVVEGSLKKHGAQLRVSARLVSVSDGFQLWAKRFDRREEDFLSVGDDAANSIAEALTVERAAPARVAPTDAVAIDLYLRARHLYHKGWRQEIIESVTLFEEALARAPDDPMILSGYALAQLRRIGNDPEAADDIGESAREAAERAISLAPYLAEARIALANWRLVMGDAVGCAKDTREAARVAKTSPDVLDLRGRLLVEVGSPEAGIACLRTATLLEPSLERAAGDIIRVKALLGDWSPVEELFESLAHATEGQNLSWFLCARMVAWRREPAWATRLRELAAPHSFPLKSVVEGTCRLIETGTLTETMAMALAMWGQVTGRARRRPMFMRQIKAELCAFVKDDASVLDALESADNLGLIDRVWLERCPLLDTYRATERYQKVHASVTARAKEVLDALT